MDQEDEGGSLKIQVKLNPGRDDLAIAFLAGVKPMFRAEMVRTILYTHLKVQQSVQAKDVSSEPTARNQPGQHGVAKGGGESAQKTEARVVDSKAKSAGQSDEYDLDQLNGLDMQTDFTGMTGGVG